MASYTRIIGIDPGLRRCGWGVIETEGNRLRFVAAGVVAPPVSGELAARLVALHEGLNAVLARFSPEEAAVEETFVNQGMRSALALGQARGVALMTPALAGLKVNEYAANLIKKTVVRHRPRRQNADPAHGEDLVAASRFQGRRCRRRAGHRHLPRPSP